MSAHNHDEEIKNRFGEITGHLRPPTPEEITGKHTLEKKGEYYAEKTSEGNWNVHLYEPVTGSFLSHVQQAKGIDAAQGLKRHSLLVQVARMYQDDAANVIAQAIESFKI